MAKKHKEKANNTSTNNVMDSGANSAPNAKPHKQTKEKSMSNRSKQHGKENSDGAGKAKSIMDCFWDLASDHPSERLKAAVSLLKQLGEKDAQEEWDYTLERLIKGLSSSRGSSRLGYSMALSELTAARKDHISVTQYLDLADKHFKIPGNASGHEERGLNFGRLFSLKVLAQSPLMFKDSTTIEEYLRYMDMTLELAQAKPWLRESVFFGICELVEKYTQFKFDASKALKETIDRVDAAQLTLTSEGVALYLSLPSDILASLGKGWKDGHPLAKGNLPVLVKALKEIAVDSEAKQKGNWKPSLHFVWPKLLAELGADTDKNTDEHQSKKRKKDRKDKKKKHSEDDQKSGNNRLGLPEFWKAVVDEGMFSSSSSTERKFWGFEIFCLFVQHTPNASVLFTPNFERCLLNQLAQSDRNLNKEAKKVFTVIQQVVKTQPQASVDLFKSFVDGVCGEGGKLDSGLSKLKKPIESLLPLVPADKLRLVVGYLVKLFDVKTNGNWLADILVYMIRTRRNEPESQEWIEQCIDLFVLHGFFATDPATAAAFQARLNSALSHLVGARRDNNSTWPYYALQKISDYEKNEKRKLTTPFDPELVKTREKSEKTLERVRKSRISSSHANAPHLAAFELLFSLVLIQVYTGDEESITLLEELQTCYNTIVGRFNTEEGDEDSEIDASQILTEILLSFLSRPSQLLRRLSEVVFGIFASKMTSQSLQLLYDILESKESLEGQQSLFEGEDEVELEDDEDEEDEGSEMEVDEEEVDKGEEDEEESSSSDEESDEDMESDEVAKAEKRANEELAKVLGVQNDDDEDNEEDESEDEEMDDEQMMALDEQLSNIFRERQKIISQQKSSKGKKQEFIQAKQNMVQIKSKVLDLLDIYVKNEGANPLIFSAILPLLTVIGTTKDVALGTKAHELLRNKICRGKSMPSVEDDDECIHILQLIHGQAKKSKNKAHALACNQTSVFVSKALLSNNIENADRITAIYAATLSEWIRKPQMKVSASLFFDLVNYVASRKKED